MAMCPEYGSIALPAYVASPARCGTVHLALDAVRDRKLAIGEALSEFNQPPVAGDAGGQTERSRLTQAVAETELSAMMTCGVNVYMRQA